MKSQPKENFERWKREGKLCRNLGVGGATWRWVFQCLHMKEEGDPGPVFPNRQPGNRSQPRWASLQMGVLPGTTSGKVWWMSLRESICFPYWAQDSPPPRDFRKLAALAERSQPDMLPTQEASFSQGQGSSPQGETLRCRVVPTRESFHKKHLTRNCSPSTIDKRDLSKMQPRDFFYPYSVLENSFLPLYLKDMFSAPAETSGSLRKKRGKLSKPK